MKSVDNGFFSKKHWLYLFLLLTPFLLYKKSLAFGFSPMDERWMIENNGWFLAHWSNLKIVFTGATALQIYYRPLLVVSTMLDFHLGKLDPFIYHLTNLLWHLGCVVLLFELLLQYKTHVRLAFFLSLIFAVHPVMLHAVAWIPGRNDSMLCFFMLASLLLLNRYTERGRMVFFLSHLFFFVCALFTKETAIVFPLIYLGAIYIKQGGNRKQQLFSSITWFLLVFGWVILRRAFVGEIDITGNQFGSVFRNTAEAFLLYVGKVLYPFQQSVFPVLKHTSVIPGIFTLFILVLLWWRFKPVDKRVAFFGCFLFFIILIIPVVFSAMKSNGEQYEHRLYAPMAGVILFLSQLRLPVKSTVSTLVFSVISFFLLVLTFQRMDVYKNQLTFLDAGIDSYPEYYYFYMQRGQILDKKGEYEQAILSFNEAIARNPRSGQSFFDRGNAYLAIGDKTHSLSDYTSALALTKGKTNKMVLLQRSIAYDVFNEPELAMKDLETLKACCPEMINPDFEKEVTKKLEIENWNRKMLASPRDAELYIKRGMFYLEQMMPAEAIADFRKATEIAPGNNEYREFYRRALIDLAPALKKQ